MNLGLFYITFGLYLGAGVFYLLQFIFAKPVLALWGARLSGIACGLQALLLGLFFAKVGSPFLTGTYISYLFSAWIIALVYLLLNLKYRFQLVGAFVFPLIAAFYLLALFSVKQYAVASPWMQSPWASFHIIFSFLALAVFSLSFILAIIFILEEFQLKHKVSPKLFLRLPNLESLEQVHANALTLGFVLLTGAMVMGALWAKSVTGVYFFEDSRQLWSIIAWLIYALFLQARFAAGWRGRKGVLLSILGFIVILFTFLGVEH